MSLSENLLRPQETSGVVVATTNDALRSHIVNILTSWKWPVQEARGGADALNKLEISECELLLLDRCLPDLDADELTAMIKAQFPGVDIMMLDSDTGRATATAPLRTPSAVYLLQTLAAGTDLSLSQNASVRRDGYRSPTSQGSAAREKTTNPAQALPGMVGDSEAARQVYRFTRLVAERETTVLLLGDSGTGKELVAQAVHKLSPRATRPFVVINCAAIPETLLESELFGYTRGAFTGAAQSRVGRIHAAQGGTLFLDEIGDLPLDLQAKLLRFLESGEVQRLGSSDVFRVDVRVVAATNAELQRKVANGEFRKDLFYRLSVFPIVLPALRTRQEDIVPLAEYFLEMMQSKPMRLSTEAMAVLQAYDWPGNVRELKHVIERATILAGADEVIGARHIMILPPESAYPKK
jgi:transcriptional regulator with GAF, ATPase, and Fis domain